MEFSIVPEPETTALTRRQRGQVALSFAAHAAASLGGLAVGGTLLGKGVPAALVSETLTLVLVAIAVTGSAAYAWGFKRLTEDANKLLDSPMTRLNAKPSEVFEAAIPKRPYRVSVLAAIAALAAACGYGAAVRVQALDALEARTVTVDDTQSLACSRAQGGKDRVVLQTSLGPVAFECGPRVR